MSTPRVEVHADGEALATAVAGELLARLVEAQEAGRDPQIALTGGGVAERIHAELARLSTGSECDWTRVVVWWGDERFVDAGSTDRNAVPARRDLLDPVGATQVHEVPASDQVADAEAAAASYSEEMREHGSGAFDVVLLGLGPDGHVASLFPAYPALDVDDQIAVAVHDSPKPPPDRISLTFGALNRTRAVWFVVSGEAKAEAVAAALADDGDLHRTPARGVAGEDETIWFLDTPSASHL